MNNSYQFSTLKEILLVRQDLRSVLSYGENEHWCYRSNQKKKKKNSNFWLFNFLKLSMYIFNRKIILSFLNILKIRTAELTLQLVEYFSSIVQSTDNTVSQIHLQDRLPTIDPKATRTHRWLNINKMYKRCIGRVPKFHSIPEAHWCLYLCSYY